MKAWILYILRIILWALRSLWRKYPKPRRNNILFSRSYMRKAWETRLSALDREYNKTRNEELLWNRRVMVAKRRAFRFE